MDRDIRFGVQVASVVLVGNLISAIVNFWTRNYLLAVAAVLWVFNLAVMIWAAWEGQRTRDEVRIALAVAEDIKRLMKERED